MPEKEHMIQKIVSELDLIERHVQMLQITKKNEPIGIIRLSEILGIPKHKVRYSLRLLEQEGLIEATAEGARVTDEYDRFMAEVSDVLDAVKNKTNKMKALIKGT